MYHDISDPLKNTEEVPSLGEGQPMQPTDEQPLWLPTNENEGAEQAARPLQEYKVMGNFGDEQAEGGENRSAERPEGEPGNSYRGTSEQVLFPLPSAPGVPYQSSQTVPTQAETGGMPPWSYPPRPELYQSATSGQPEMTPGQFGQPHDTFGQPGGTPGQFGVFHSAATTPMLSPGGGPGGQPLPPPRRRSGLRTGALLALAVLLALVFGTGLFAGWQFGRSGVASSPISNNAFQSGNSSAVTVPTPSGSNADAIREAVISKVQPAIVQINVFTGNQQELGSGVIIDRRGYIVTNNHVVSGASSIQVTLANNQTLPAQVAGTDSVDDLAVIKITPPASGLTTLTLGDSSQLRPGQEVLAIGSPLGNAETVTSGIISALNRNVSEGQGGPTLPDAIQTDAPINPGNSGGALVNLQGNLIGMPTLNAVDTEFNTPANGLGFAIPVNRIRYIAQQIVTDGRVTHTGRPILGVVVTNITRALAAQDHLNINSGVLIVDVTAGGPSASAGLKANDVITQVGNRTINNTTDLSTTLLQQKPGDSVTLKVQRGSQQLAINVTLGELAAR